jgi:hypothetical protein
MRRLRIAISYLPRKDIGKLIYGAIVSKRGGKGNTKSPQSAPHPLEDLSFPLIVIPQEPKLKQITQR